MVQKHRGAGEGRGGAGTPGHQSKLTVEKVVPPCAHASCALRAPTEMRSACLLFATLPFRRPPLVMQRRLVHPWLSLEAANREPTGPSSLQQLPDFKGPARLLKEAYKASQLVVPNPKIQNAQKRAAKHATQTIDAYATELSVNLREQLKVFREVMGALPPFESQLASLTLAALERDGGRSLSDVEADFDLLRRAVVRTGKAATAEASKSSSFFEAKELMEAGIKSVEDVFNEQREALDELIQTVGKLRRLPRPVTGEPVLVLVGMPNVGKSSLVTATSTGTPEISNYPFTTRQLKLGHVIGVQGRYQVMDTPGLLARTEDERNPMEGLTLAAVEHLPSAVVYVMDLSGTSGAQSAPLLQLRVREQVRERYPGRPWLDVRTKADLPLADEVLPETVPHGTLDVSVVDGTNVALLKRRMAQLVGDRGGS